MSPPTFRRSERGFVTMDMQLDVVAEADRSWKWKNKDDFQALIDRDLIDGTVVTSVRGEARRVIADLEADRPPLTRVGSTGAPTRRGIRRGSLATGTSDGRFSATRRRLRRESGEL
jgi:hypothetical protein